MKGNEMFKITNRVDEMPQVTTKRSNKSQLYKDAFDAMKVKGDSFFVPNIKEGTLAAYFHNYCKENYGISSTKPLYVLEEVKETDDTDMIEEGVNFFLIKHPRDLTTS